MSPYSSFTDCVRKHHVTSTSSKFFNSGPKGISCTLSASSLTGCITPSSELASLRSLSKSMTFISCKWSMCDTNEAGAAIACSDGNIILTIEKCSFSYCSAYEKGGAIYTSSIHTLDVTESLFHRCSTSTVENDEGSGAIWINSIQEKLSVSENSFISCTSKASGGAFIVKDCTENINGQLITNCIFFDCNATDESPDGGAVWIWINDGLIGITNCMFSHCEGYFGGGFQHECNGYQINSHPFQFIFFNRNTGEYGTDGYLVGNVVNGAFLHCFSTSDEPRIYNGNNNWLHFSAL